MAINSLQSPPPQNPIEYNVVDTIEAKTIDKRTVFIEWLLYENPIDENNKIMFCKLDILRLDISVIITHRNTVSINNIDKYILNLFLAGGLSYRPHLTLKRYY